MKRYFLIIPLLLIFYLIVFSKTSNAISNSECENLNGTCKDSCNSGSSETPVQTGEGIIPKCDGSQKICCRFQPNVVAKCSDRGGVCYTNPGPSSNYTKITDSGCVVDEYNEQYCNYCNYQDEGCYIQNSEAQCGQGSSDESSFQCYQNQCPLGHYPWDNSQGLRLCPSGSFCCTNYDTGVRNDGGVGIYCEGDKAKGINTALGCIKVESGNDLITTILRFAIGVGGGLALALILYGVFIVTTSAGIPDKLKAGSEIITSAIIGLIFILLSVFLFKLIGYNILGIPGLT